MNTIKRSDKPLGRMDFFPDQHRSSDWVYLAASANMAFWVFDVVECVRGCAYADGVGLGAAGGFGGYVFAGVATEF